MYEQHFAAPMAGALLYTINIRHDLAMVSTFLKHSGAKLIFVDVTKVPMSNPFITQRYDEKMEEFMKEAFEQYLIKKEGTIKQRTDEEKARGKWSDEVEDENSGDCGGEDVVDGSKPYKTLAGETTKADCVFLCLGKPLASLWMKKNILRDSLDANWSNGC
nr:probable acyl-activating enzyme 1, peroxisomal [Tanacetum cinerariifolium]